MTLVKNLKKYSFSNKEKLLFYETIMENPYVKYKPYPKQAIPIFLANRPEEKVGEVKNPITVLTGAGGFGGKSYLGSMLAVQYLQEPDYTCLVTRRNYAELLDTNSIWENLLEWCCDKERLGSLSCEAIKTPVPRIEAPNGNTIYFKAFDREDKKGKFKSASYDRIINDEASELPKGILSFQYRSVRNTSEIPRSIINLSNPGGESTEYLVKEFVDGNSPYVSLDWRDNPFIDREAYEGSLNKLDYIDQQYQKYGNWHYQPTDGDLININELNAAKIKTEDYVNHIPLYNVIGIDLAGNGRDFTVATSLTLFDNGKIICTGIYRDSSAYPEEGIYKFILEQYQKFKTFKVVFEREPGGDNLYSLRYWKNELEDLIYDYGIIVDDTPPIISKFNRARPVAHAVSQKRVFFDDAYELEDLFNQFIYVCPNPEEMKKKKSPDDLDSLGYAYTEIQKVAKAGVMVR